MLKQPNMSAGRDRAHQLAERAVRMWNRAHGESHDTVTKGAIPKRKGFGVRANDVNLGGGISGSRRRAGKHGRIGIGRNKPDAGGIVVEIETAPSTDLNHTPG